MTNIICFGDSITHAYHFPEKERWPTILQELCDRARPDSVRVFNRGMGRQTSAIGLAGIYEQVVPLLPGIVLIEFGINDVHIKPGYQIPTVGPEEFRINMLEIHRIVSANGGEAIFIINHTLGDKLIQDESQDYTLNCKQYNAAIREIAATAKGATIDLPAMMAQREIDVSEFVGNDGLHLSTVGNRQYAEMVFAAIQARL